LNNVQHNIEDFDNQINLVLNKYNDEYKAKESKGNLGPYSQPLDNFLAYLAIDLKNSIQLKSEFKWLSNTKNCYLTWYLLRNMTIRDSFKKIVNKNDYESTCGYIEDIPINEDSYLSQTVESIYKAIDPSHQANLVDYLSSNIPKTHAERFNQIIYIFDSFCVNKQYKQKLLFYFKTTCKKSNENVFSWVKSENIGQYEWLWDYFNKKKKLFPYQAINILKPETSKEKFEAIKLVFNLMVLDYEDIESLEYISRRLHNNSRKRKSRLNKKSRDKVYDKSSSLDHLKSVTSSRLIEDKDLNFSIGKTGIKKLEEIIKLIPKKITDDPAHLEFIENNSRRVSLPKSSVYRNKLLSLSLKKIVSLFHKKTKTPDNITHLKSKDNLHKFDKISKLEEEQNQIQEKIDKLKKSICVQYISEIKRKRYNLEKLNKSEEVELMIKNINKIKNKKH
jgi:hypothetical protein